MTNPLKTMSLEDSLRLRAERAEAACAEMRDDLRETKEYTEQLRNDYESLKGDFNGYKAIAGSSGAALCDERNRLKTQLTLALEALERIAVNTDDDWAMGLANTVIAAVKNQA